MRFSRSWCFVIFTAFGRRQTRGASIIYIALCRASGQRVVVNHKICPCFHHLATNSVFERMLRSASLA